MNKISRKVKLTHDSELSVDKGLVIVGANGCGKTRLGVRIADLAENKNLVRRISAQKSLSFASEVTLNSSKRAYGEHQNKHFDNLTQPTRMLNDYQELLNVLFAEKTVVNDSYREDSKKTEKKIPVPITKLDKIKTIWNEVLPGRELIIGSNFIKAKSIAKGSEDYPGSEMSDGERVIFYLIGQCLLAPENAMIIIDEPEMHLHKAIQSTLWNKIERERSDCIFVYLTHDVAFAASRSGFEKVWLESYDGQDNWELKQLKESQELPEELLLELYGSRRRILLIEGNAGSNESRFYQNLFEDFLVKPCGSCENVISYVKALKNNAEFHHEQVYGLIDRDRRTDEEIEALKKYSVFTLEVAEFENLFATPEILEIVAERISHDPEKKLEEVKTFVFNEFNEEFNTQIQLHFQQEIKYRLNRLDLSKLKVSNSLTDLINDDINADNIKQGLEEAFTAIRDNKNYTLLLKKYNRKTIASQIGAIFGLKTDELPKFVVRLSDKNDFQEKLRNAVLVYFPPEFNDLQANMSQGVKS